MAEFVVIYMFLTWIIAAYFADKAAIRKGIGGLGVSLAALTCPLIIFLYAAASPDRPNLGQHGEARRDD